MFPLDAFLLRLRLEQGGISMPLNPSDYSVLFAILAVLLLAALILLAVCNAKRKKLAGTAFPIR